jgi:hypothetical protein
MEQISFNVIIPQPFSLARHSEQDKNKIVEFIMNENIRKCQASMSGFSSEYQEYADFWRVRRAKSNRDNRNLFNSRTGETHRGIETLATFWFRVMTSKDPFFEVIASGLDENGIQLSSEDLYAVEQILIKQKSATHYKEKLLNVLRSLATFGAVVVEQPWVQKPITGRKYFEATDFVISPLIKTYFDTSRSTIDESHYIANCDYLTDYAVVDMAENDTETYDVDEINKNLELKNSGTRNNLDAWANIQERKSRAGYGEQETGLNEVINYHGRLNKSCLKTSLIEDLWISEGDPDQNPANVDFTFKIMNGNSMIAGYPTQYGDWHTRFKTAVYKRFELEPLGYGVPKIGKKAQLSMDFMTSNASDTSTLSLFNQFLVSSYSGIKQSQLNVKPLNMIEVEDINTSIKPFSPDINGIAYAINLINQLREDFRSTTGASTTLQAQVTGASATESSLAQNEAVRQQSVHGEIFSETLGREHFEDCHLNNLNNLDAEIWVSLSGNNKPEYRAYSRVNLPKSIGIRWKTSSDSDYRPERIGKLTQAFQLLSSIRQMIPEQIVINGSNHLSKEIFRELGIDPRLLENQVNIADSIEYNSRMNQLSGRSPAGSGSLSSAGNEIASEAGQGTPPQTANGLAVQSTPVGPVGGSVNQGGI